MDGIRQYIQEVQDTLDRLPIEPINHAVETLNNARAAGSSVFIMGNGGSAATASHFVCDLSKNTRVREIPHFRVVGLADSMAAFSAYANDEGYENVFIRQLESLLYPGDVVIGISASGNSPNVLNAIEYANNLDATTIGLTGYHGGLLGGMVNIHINVPSHSIEQVEDIHMVVEHMITASLRELAECHFRNDIPLDTRRKIDSNPIYSIASNKSNGGDPA